MVGPAGDMQKACGLTSKGPGAEWMPVPSGFRDLFSVMVTLSHDRNYREQNMIVGGEQVNALISETPMTQML